MGTSGQLAAVLSQSLGFKPGNVQFYGQALRDEGLLSTAGRGPAAAAMTKDDAANWLIAMCSAETAKSAAAVVKLTRATPLRAEPEIRGDLNKDLAFLKARTVGELLTALLEDEAAHRLGDIYVDLNFLVGGGHVHLTAGQADSDSGFKGRVEMEFIHTYKPGKALPIRRRDLEETPITAKRRTINRISRGVIEDINSVLVETAQE